MVRDPSAMAKFKGWGTVAPFYIEQEAPVPPGGLPHPAPLKVQLRNDHLQYAITWYGLAAVLVVMFAIWALAAPRHGRLNYAGPALPALPSAIGSRIVGSGENAGGGPMPVIRFAKAVALAAVLLGSALAGGAQAQTIELKLSHFVPPNHTFHKWAMAWGEQLDKESNGRLKFTIYPNGQLVGPPNRQFDAARNGITDMAFVLHGVTPGRYPMTELVNLAFTWPKAGSEQRDHVEADDRARAELSRQGARGPAHPVDGGGMPIVVESKMPIAKLDDFKGVKIRYAGAQNRSLYDALGAVPLLIAAAGVPGRAGQGHHRRRDVPARGGAVAAISARSPSTRPSRAWPRRRSRW